MKRYYDYDKKELAILTEEQVDFLVNLEIAEAGIMPIECPMMPGLEAEGISRTEIVFKVKDILVKTEAEALQICQMNILKEEYDYHTGYDYKWLDPMPQIQPIQQVYFRQEDVSRIAKILQDNKRKKEEYEGKKKIYDDFIKKTGEIRQKVWGQVNEAKDYYREIELTKQTFLHYMNLTDQNREIAEKFLKNTYKNREDLINEVLNT